MQLISDVAVAVVQPGSCSSYLSPSLGTSICQRCDPKKKKKKKRKRLSVEKMFLESIRGALLFKKLSSETSELVSSRPSYSPCRDTAAAMLCHNHIWPLQQPFLRTGFQLLAFHSSGEDLLSALTQHPKYEYLLTEYLPWQPQPCPKGCPKG